MALQQAGIIIRQSDLQQIHDLEAEITDKQLALAQLTDNVKQLLFAKAPIEKGRFDARLNYIAMRNPPWKQIVIEQLGQSYMEEVRRGTKAVTRCELQIIEHAIPPLWKQLESETTPVE